MPPPAADDVTAHDGLAPARENLVRLNVTVKRDSRLVVAVRRGFLEGEQVLCRPPRRAPCGDAAGSSKSAPEKYREVTITILAAAISDLFLRGACMRSVSTRKYCEMLRAEGVNLENKDIDHIIPRSRGGPDMPWNYNPLDASSNRAPRRAGRGGRS